MISAMKSNPGPILDMTPSGEFAGPPKPKLADVVARFVGFLILLGVGIAAFWITLFSIPFLILGGLALYALYWWKRPSVHGPRVIIRTSRRR